jgi:hypothetical protein
MSEALTLVMVATAIGVPLGVAMGRWGWELLGTQIGVPPAPAMPVLVVPAVTATMVLAALLIAVWPGVRAARVTPGVALRAE